MKFPLLCLALTSLLQLSGVAQGSPSGITYQAIARDEAGNEIANQGLSVTFTIHQAAIDGAIAYEESHTTVTNMFGLFTLVIGQGIPTGEGFEASLSDLDWAGYSHFLRVQVDLPDSTGQLLLGVTQLLTVPYAFHATTAEYYEEADGDPDNETISDIALSGNTLTVTESGNTFDVDLSAIAGSDDDSDPANETITSLTLDNYDLTVTEAGTGHTTSLAVLEDGWDANATTTSTDLNVGINTSNPQSSLHVSGSVSYSVVSVNTAGDFYLTDTHHVVICNVDAGTINVHLPAAATCTGRVYIIKRFATDILGYNADVWLMPEVGDNIDGANMYVLASIYEQFVTVISDGNDWWIINQYQNDN